MAEFKSDRSYRIFAQSVTRYNRYIRNQESEEFLSTLLKTSEGHKLLLTKDSRFWRAQLGHDWMPVYQDDEYIDDIPIPFPPERMKPLNDRAREGRANPKGIPYLYGANRMETALSEVRPWIGSLISLAIFAIHKDLKIVDFSTKDKALCHFLEGPEPNKKEKTVWADIDRAFSKPVTVNDEVADYAPTQIIAELFKSKGLDGIAYSSSFAAGANITLFDIKSANLVNCSLYEVKDIAFDFQTDSTGYSVKGGFEANSFTP